MNKILIVEDDRAIARIERDYLERNGFSVTLEEDGRCLFPDAPTLRGAKHLRELARLAREGVCAHLVFVVQMAGMLDVSPNAATDPDFARALWEAREAGVRLHALSCAVTPDSLAITGALPVLVPFPGETS